MKQEDKQLLLKDLCARLSHGVICNTPKGDGYLNSINQTIFDVELGINIININSVHRDTFKLENCKPYLRPMSSMTKEENKEMYHDCYIVSIDFDRRTTDMVAVPNSTKIVDWFNAHHFDYRNLIEKNLAIEVTEENNPYKE